MFWPLTDHALLAYVLLSICAQIRDLTLNKKPSSHHQHSAFCIFGLQHGTQSVTIARSPRSDHHRHQHDHTSPSTGRRLKSPFPNCSSSLETHRISDLFLHSLLACEIVSYPAPPLSLSLSLSLEIVWLEKVFKKQFYLNFVLLCFQFAFSSNQTNSTIVIRWILVAWPNNPPGATTEPTVSRVETFELWKQFIIDGNACVHRKLKVDTKSLIECAFFFCPILMRISIRFQSIDIILTFSLFPQQKSSRWINFESFCHSGWLHFLFSYLWLRPT